MGPETQHNAASLKEFKSEIEPLKRIVEVALTFLHGKISDKDTHLRVALAERAELMFTHGGSLSGMIAVIEGREILSSHVAVNVSEIRHLVEFFQKELGVALGKETVTAAISTLSRIEDCEEVTALAKEYKDTRNI